MSRFHVFQDDRGMLTCENINGIHVGSFEADNHRDQVMAIIDINMTLDHPDPFWLKKGIEIEANGI